MVAKHLKFAAAVTLVEVMVAMSVLSIATLGALSYQYLAAKHARLARAQITGTRTAQLLLEDWKSTGGSGEYDPATLGLGFSTKLQVPSFWSEGEGVGIGTPLRTDVYYIIVDNVPMWILLRWRDIDYDSTAEVTLRQLGVIINCDQSYGVLPIVLSTYVRIDGAGG